ncbi:MAG: DUF2269 family protein [Candidatus Eremiobacteraeota bacterium]|nr:DUF2269 family protein [Candidatus Eremiobacteraeota bacterium]MBV8366662.1 DUF2269 family protein [Candidatus Eremiobacteraeota bacterium]
MWIVFFHVAAVFVGFALTAGIGIFLSGIARSGDPRAIRAAGRAGVPLATVGGVLVTLGALLGFGAAEMLGFPLNASWLVLTYVFVGLIIIDGFFFRRRWVVALTNAAEASPDDEASEELQRIANDRLAAVTGPLSGLLWLATLIMMTVKPHLW